ncbi:MAG: OsmC family protein [Bacteroidales bacterium]
MKHTVRTSWKKDMAFEADINGHSLMMDAPEEAGGNDRGPRPKPLMLASLAGCTGMDVVGILKKMRVEITGFDILIEAEVTEEAPKHYQKMKVIYEFTGKDLPEDKLKKAVDLSREKYCGVSYVYKQVIDMEYDVRIKEEN